ncbi:MAG: hypothetical protein HRF45_10250 [Fimbriimonadia bacterium]|jgi:hypothetical protein
MTLEERFRADLLRTYVDAAKRGYHATYFMQMLETYGGVEMAKRLLDDDQVQSGLYRLAELGLLRLSVENLVLNPVYDELFLSSVKNAARKRLEDLGFEPGGWD